MFLLEISRAGVASKYTNEVTGGDTLGRQGIAKLGVPFAHNFLTTSVGKVILDDMNVEDKH